MNENKTSSLKEDQEHVAIALKKTLVHYNEINTETMWGFTEEEIDTYKEDTTSALKMFLNYLILSAENKELTSFYKSLKTEIVLQEVDENESE